MHSSLLAENVKFPEPYWKAHCAPQNVLTPLVASSLKYVRDTVSSFEKKSWYSSSIIGSDISWGSQGVSVSRKPDLKRLLKSHKEGQTCSWCTAAALRELPGEALRTGMGLEKQKHAQSRIWQEVQRVTRRVSTDQTAAKGTQQNMQGTRGQGGGWGTPSLSPNWKTDPQQSQVHDTRENWSGARKTYSY